MPSTTFDDFDHAIDLLHERLDDWDSDGTLTGIIGADGVSVLRLMIHEWVANLVQHATFLGAHEIVLEIDAELDAIRCTIEDSSAGFDFAAQVEHQQAVLEAPAPSERGRGLLMLVTCAEELAYRPATNRKRQRVSFVLHDPVQGNLAPLFHDATLLPDADELLLQAGEETVSDPAAQATP